MSDSVSFAFRAGKCLLLCNTDTHIGASHAGSDSPFLRKGSVMKGTENSAKRCMDIDYIYGNFASYAITNFDM